MQTSPIVHGVWGLVAIATFAIGALSKSSKDRALADSAGGGSGTRSTSPTVSGLPGGTTQPSRQATTRNGTDGSGQDEVSGDGVGLSVAQVKLIATDALTDPNPLNRSLAFSKLLEGITPENAEAMQEALREGNASRDQWRLFLYAWGVTDGPGALEHAASNLEGDRLHRFQGEVLTGWASTDPDAAISWAAGIEDPELASRMRFSLVGGLADHDIGYATDFAFRMADEGDRNASRYIDSIASEQMRKGGLDSTLVWAEGLPDGSLKGSALDRVASSYVQKEPEAAAAWAEQFASTDWGVRVIEEIGDEWAERDPTASVAWLETLPQGAGRSEGTYSAFREWAQRDARAASEHLVSMQDSAAKDHAVRGLARTIASRDPEAAVAWANTIGSDQMRTETLTRAAREWFRRDRAAAAEWLTTSGLPAEAQQQITSPPRDGDGRRRG